MKYHYQKGIVGKDKKGHRKMWLGFFTIFTIATYVGFLFAVLNLNGWPIDTSSSTVAVKQTKPQDGKLFIPNLNVVTDSSKIKVSGDPSYSDVTVTGPTFGVGFTPTSLRQASPFYNIDELQDGDEIFLDSQGVRYAYKVAANVDSEDQKLTIKNGNKTVVAKTIGTINWDGNEPRLEVF